MPPRCRRRSASIAGASVAVPTPPPKAPPSPKRDATAQRAVMNHFSSDDGSHISLAGYLGGHNGQASHALFFHLRRAERSFHRLWLDSKKEDATVCQKAMQTYFANDPSRSKAFASLKGPGTPPPPLRGAHFHWPQGPAGGVRCDLPPRGGCYRQRALGESI